MFDLNIILGNLLNNAIEAIEKAGYDNVTPVIVTNTAEYKEIIPASYGSKTAKEEIIEVRVGK